MLLGGFSSLPSASRRVTSDLRERGEPFHAFEIAQIRGCDGGRIAAAWIPMRTHAGRSRRCRRKPQPMRRRGFSSAVISARAARAACWGSASARATAEGHAGLKVVSSSTRSARPTSTPGFVHRAQHGHEDAFRGGCRGHC